MKNYSQFDTVKGKHGKITVYMAGDSLVQTYDERYAPQTGWGQMLPMYFDDNVRFENHAIGGRSTGNFLRQGRLDAILNVITPGDYVLIEFGHNDATVGNADRYVSVEDFKKNISQIYVREIRRRGGIPVLVTLCNRNDYDVSTGVFNVSFPEYVDAMRECACMTEAPLIDLNAITVKNFTKMNRDFGIGVTEALIYNHAEAGVYSGEYAGGVKDNTHLQRYGAKVVAGYVAEEIHKLNLPGLSEHYMLRIVES